MLLINAILICVFCTIYQFVKSNKKTKNTKFPTNNIDKSNDINNINNDNDMIVTKTFSQMFEEPSVWETGLGARTSEDAKTETLNKFFVAKA